MPDTRKKLTVGIVLTAVLVLAVVAHLYVRHRSRSAEIVADRPRMDARTLMHLSGVHQTSTKDGAVQWKLKALAAELESTDGQMILEQPEVAFFMKDGGQVNVTARKGILNTRTNNIEVRGNVMVDDGRYQLTTETLVYDHETRILLSTSPVRIEGKTMSFSAANMRYNLDTRQALFSGRVKGKLDEELAL
jgi:LPS export ABC transporter protein LptC